MDAAIDGGGYDIGGGATPHGCGGPAAGAAGGGIMKGRASGLGALQPAGTGIMLPSAPEAEP
jgi:hypothetical protein